MGTTIFPSVNDVAPAAGSGKTMTEANLIKWLKSLANQNFIITGFVPPASSASLTLAIPLGQACIDGRIIDIDSSTNVLCTASATNHIYLKLTKDGSQNVTGASFEANITGTAPADSVKIATAVATGTTITSTTDVRVFNTPQLGGLRNLLDPATQVYTGASVRYKKNGTQVPANTLRLEQGKFGQMPLLEGASTNQVTHSDLLDDASWTKQNVSITPNSIAAPNDTVTADTITATGATLVNHQVIFPYTASAGATITVSAFLKKGTAPYAAIGSGLGPSWFRQWVDMTAGTLVNADPGVTGTIKDMGGGWYRVTATFTLGTGVTATDILIAPAVTNSSINYIANSESVYAWRAQLEVNGYATTGIATSGAAVLRSADQLYYTLAQPLPKQNFGALVWTPEQSSTVTKQKVLLNIVTLANNARYQIQYDRGGNVGKFWLGKSVDGSSFAELASVATSFSAGDGIFIAWADDPTGSGTIKLWIGVNNGALAEYSLANTSQLTDAQKVYAGCFSSAGYECNGTIDFPILSDVLPTTAQVEALYRAQDWGGMRNYPGIISAETKTPAGDTIFTDAGGTLKGSINFTDTDRKIRVAGPDFYLENAVGTVNIGGKLYTQVLANAYYDGANWMRRDTAQPAVILGTDATNSRSFIMTAPAGANPISWGAASTMWNDGDLRTWGSVARMQGIMIMTTGTITDDGAGVVTLGSLVHVMNPVAGSYVAVAAGAYTLGTWGYLYIDIPPTIASGATVTPQVGVWTSAARNYDHKDRIIIAQRVSSGAICFNGAFRARLFGSVPDADTVDGNHAADLMGTEGTYLDTTTSIPASSNLTVNIPTGNNKKVAYFTAKLAAGSSGWVAGFATADANKNMIMHYVQPGAVYNLFPNVTSPYNAGGFYNVTDEWAYIRLISVKINGTNLEFIFQNTTAAAKAINVEINVKAW